MIIIIFNKREKGSNKLSNWKLAFKNCFWSFFALADIYLLKRFKQMIPTGKSFTNFAVNFIQSNTFPENDYLSTR